MHIPSSHLRQLQTLHTIIQRVGLRFRFPKKSQYFLLHFMKYSSDLLLLLWFAFQHLVSNVSRYAVSQKNGAFLKAGSQYEWCSKMCIVNVSPCGRAACHSDTYDFFPLEQHSLWMPLEIDQSDLSYNE